jgi:hypothetical protein
MGLRVSLATLVLLALPAPAVAWVETATYDVPGGDPATCLRVADPGHVSLLDLSRPTTTDLLSAAPTSFVPGPSTAVGDRWHCPAIATADGATPLLAGWRHAGRRGLDVLRIASPGGRAVEVRSVRNRGVSDPIVALAPGGAAAVAWIESAVGSGGRDQRLYVVERASAGAPFGRPTRLGTTSVVLPGFALGIDAAGRATVAWREDRRVRGGWRTRLMVAAGTPDGRFGPPQRLASSWRGPVALSVLPDGRALLAAETRDRSSAFERLSGGTGFVPVRLGSGWMEEVAAALAPNGGAVIAYRNPDRAVLVTLRAPGGAFGRWETVVLPARTHEPFSVSSFERRSPDDYEGRKLHAALGADGEVALTWVDDARGHEMATAYAAHGTLVGGMERPEQLGGPCRSAAAAAPVRLADGRLAVIWSDDAHVRRITEDTLPLGGGRVHLVHGGAGGATPAVLRGPPHLSARILDRALEPGQALRVRVRCDGAACDARVLARARSAPRSGGDFGGGDQAIWFAATTTLPQGASATVSLPRLWGFNAAGVPDRPRTPIDVIACAPGGPVLDRAELAPPRSVVLPPLPRILDLRAERRPSGAIRVTWRTSAPAVRVRFAVILEPGYRGRRQLLPGRGRSRFAIELPPPRRSVRSVIVGIQGPAASFGRSVSAPIA